MSPKATPGWTPLQRSNGTTMRRESSWLPLQTLNLPRKPGDVMAAYRYVSPSLSTEEGSLMNYLQTPPDAGPTVGQVTVSLESWEVR